MSKGKSDAVRDALKAKGIHSYRSLSELEIEAATQRSLNRAWVKSHMADFDPELFGEIVVSHRGGRYLVVDGQHRVEMLRAMGWDGDQKVPCIVYEGLTLAEEASLFIGLADRKGVRTFDKFRIAIVSGDPVACDIDRIVRSQGLVLSDQKKDGAIVAVSALERVYNGAGIAQQSATALAKALKIIKSAWGVDASAFEGAVILGAGMLFLRYNGSLDEPALSHKLSKIRGGPSGLVGRAKGVMESKHRQLGHCVAAELVDAYNAGRRSGKLEDWWA